MRDERLNGGSGVQTFVVFDTLLKKYNGNEKELRLPGFIYGIGDRAFAGNEKIKSVTLSSNAAVIGESAFDGCKSLEKVILPYGLKSIDKLAFNGCATLKSIIFNGTKERWLSVKKGEKWFGGTPDFVIFCKNGEITKRDELEIESEPRADFDSVNIQAAEGDGDPSKSFERFRLELLARMKREADDDDNDINFPTDEFDNKEMSDFELRYKALKLCIERGVASVSMFQRSFPIDYMRACKLIDWMEKQGYVSASIGFRPRQVLITEEEFEKIFSEPHCEEAIFYADTDEESDEQVSITDRLLEKMSHKEVMQNLATVLSRIADKKRDEVATDVVPSNSMWSDEEEFARAVMDRLAKLVRSNLKMARRGAIKKAETYLEAVKDTCDGAMAQVYERLVYELKTTSDNVYNQIRDFIRKE